MKKIVWMLVLSLGFLMAEDFPAKVVYDLTTKSLATFERKILKSVVANQAYYNSKLREYDVTVVIHGGAYRFFLKDPQHSAYKKDHKLLKEHESLAKRIKSMVDTYDVEFLICEAGMKKRHIKATDIYEFVDIVPNAMIGLIDRQNEGYAYLPVGD